MRLVGWGLSRSSLSWSPRSLVICMFTPIRLAQRNDLPCCCHFSCKSQNFQNLHPIWDCLRAAMRIFCIHEVDPHPRSLARFLRSLLIPSCVEIVFNLGPLLVKHRPRVLPHLTRGIAFIGGNGFVLESILLPIYRSISYGGEAYPRRLAGSTFPSMHCS
jgi:hypothetical protein